LTIANELTVNHQIDVSNCQTETSQELWCIRQIYLRVVSSSDSKANPIPLHKLVERKKPTRLNELL
jgi:hypothetical protein